MDSRLLVLLQWCDSNFPSGAFAHSFGLETYIHEEKVQDRATFAHWLRVYLEKQLINTDGLAFRLTYEAVELQQPEVIWDVDQILFAQNVPQESREANRRMGERMIQLGIDLYEFPLLVEYKNRLRAKQSFGHPSIVFAIIASHFHVSKEAALLSFLYSTLAALVQNGVRGIPLGQTDGQRILSGLHPDLGRSIEAISKMDSSELGQVSPGLEIAQMRHERLHVRLFMS
jgi:urease accessory protein